MKNIVSGLKNVLKMPEKDKSIQGYVDGVFWERNTLNIQQKSIKKKQSVSANSITNLFD
jgi:hypothetical protein